VALLCLFFGQQARAQEDIVPGPRYVDGRAAALGGASLPIGDDAAAALFNNPADVGKFRGQHIEPINFELYGNSGYVGNFSLTDPSFYKVTSLSSYYPTLVKNPGSYASIGGSELASFWMKSFAFGVLMQSHMAALENQDGTVTYRSTYQLIPTMATGFRLAGGIIRIGYSMQWVNEAVGLVTADPTQATLGYNQNLQQGSAISHNLGMALTLPVAYLPQFDLVARNVLGANYSSFSLYSFSPNPTGPPQTDPMTVDASFSIQPKLGSGAYMNFVTEYRDVLDASQVPVMGRLAFGAEFSFRDSVFLRGGWGSGYPDLGVGFRRANGEFNLTWFSEDVGASYHALRDTRFMLQYSIRAF
jgi:hypothetical protein